MEILRSFGYILLQPDDISEPVGNKILNTVDFLEETYDKHTALITDTQRSKVLRKDDKINKLSNLYKDAECEINKIQVNFANIDANDYEKKQASEIINRARKAATTSIKNLEKNTIV